jgi:hypothetical protein
VLNALLPTRAEFGFLGLDQDFNVVDIGYVVWTMSDFLQMKKSRESSSGSQLFLIT